MPVNATRRLLLVSTKRKRPAKPASFNLVESSDPAQALERLSREPFEAVAVELSRKTALDFVSRVRESHPAVIVVLVVPRKDEVFKRTALDAGAHAVVATELNSPARLGLLEMAIGTVQLARLNQKLAKTAWTTAQDLAQAVRASRDMRASRQSPRR
jgi:hypothetical protein